MSVIGWLQGRVIRKDMVEWVAYFRAARTQSRREEHRGEGVRERYRTRGHSSRTHTDTRRSVLYWSPKKLSSQLSWQSSSADTVVASLSEAVCLYSLLSLKKRMRYSRTVLLNRIPHVPGNGCLLEGLPDAWYLLVVLSSYLKILWKHYVSIKYIHMI